MTHHPFNPIWYSLLVVVGVVVVLMGLAPAVEGAGSYYRFSDLGVDCVTGTVTFTMSFDLQAGDRVQESVTIWSEGQVILQDQHESILAAADSRAEATFSGIPLDGRLEMSAVVYDGGGTLLTSTSLYAECPAGTGDTTFVNGGAPVSAGDGIKGASSPAPVGPGVLPPPPTARVLGTVVDDTPLYAAPDIQTATEQTLLAGQTWFVVGTAQDTAGETWYEVFVGSVNTAYVPATSMTLSGPVPR